MTQRLKRRIALLLIGLLAFAQGSVALAACSMERGESMQMSQAADPCDCDTKSATEAARHATQQSTQQSNICVAHCTADLQLAGSAPVLVRAPAELPILLVVPGREYSSGRMAYRAPPAHAVPPRILLHSFLI